MNINISFLLWLSSCEQSSYQTKCDPFPSITKKFKRYQRDANDREPVPTKKKEKSPAGKRENTPVRKQTKSSSSIKETSKKQQSATAQEGENAPENAHSDVPLCTGKQ